MLCPQAHNNLLPRSVSSQVDYYTSKVTAVVSMTLTAADIQGADLYEPLALFGIAIQKVPGEHSRQRPTAGSHSSQTRYAISLSYIDHLEIGGRRRPDSSSGCCHNSLHMSRHTASFSIVPQLILTLRIPSLTSRSPAYHCGHLNWVIGIVIATRVSKRPPADLAIHYNTLRAAKSNQM